MKKFNGKTICSVLFGLSLLLITLPSCTKEDQAGGKLEILSIQPIAGTCGDIITIFVKNFKADFSSLQVNLNGNPVKVQGAVDDRIRILLEDGYESGQIEIINDGQTALSQQELTVIESKPITITGLSATQGFSGNDIIISGENFSSKPFENEVIFERQKWEVISASPTQLRVRIPFKINRRDKIQVKVKCQSAESEEEFWINTSAGSWNQFWNNRWHDGSPVESENFIVYSEASSQEMRQQIAEEAEVAYADIKTIINYEEGEFRFRSDYKTEQIHIMADFQQQNQAGLAYRDGLIIRAKDSPRFNGDEDRWHKVFQHEITHVVEFLLIGEFQHRQANTVWMREGFANYGARNHRIQTLNQLKNWQDLMRNVPGGGNPIEIRIWSDFPAVIINSNRTIEYYGFFELTVRYLLDPKGQGKTIDDLKAYFDDLGLGMPVEEAFLKHFEMDMEALQANWWTIMEEYLKE